ncbi:hypothetical protein SB719_18750 [Pantoea sp. SIMBA_079]|uniref:hypothetical protein n=2 Tax=Bacteria TaxID=2 RepID=UPI003993A9CD
MKPEEISIKSKKSLELIEELSEKLIELGFDLSKIDVDEIGSPSISEVFNHLKIITSTISSSNDTIKSLELYFQKEDLIEFNSVLDSILSCLRESIESATPWIEQILKEEKTDSELEQIKKAINIVQTISIYSIPRHPLTPNLIPARQVYDLSISNLNEKLDQLKPLFRFLSYNPKSAKEISLKELRKLNKEVLTSLTKSTSLIEEIKRNVRASASIKKEMEHLHSSSNHLTEEMEDYCTKADENIEKIKSQALKNQSLLDESNESRDKIEQYRLLAETLVDETTKDRDTIHKQLSSTQEAIAKVESASSTASKAADILNGLKEQSKEVLQKANDILTTSGSVVLGQNFEGQYTEAKAGLKLWPIAGAISLSVAIGICIYAIQTHIERGGAAIIIARLAIAPIALIGVWFSASQYIKQKHIIEDYAYKKTLALSLVSFKKELKETKTSHEREYMLEVLKELHKSPLDSLDKKFIREEVKLLEKMRVNFLKEVSESINGNKQDNKKQTEEKKETDDN